MRQDTAVVTGGAGFIGSHLVDALLAAGWEVVVVDDLSAGDPERLPHEVDLECVDVTDADALGRVVDAARPRAIFHLAAQASVTTSVSDPERDCRVNVIGTLRVLEAAQRHSAPVVLTSTGGALYGDDAPLPTPETRPPEPVSPYGASKLAAEAYVKTWSRSGRLPHSICRLANVYGPRQSPHGEAGVVAIFADRLARGEAPVLYGFGVPTRDYVYVADVAAALTSALGHAGTFNVGSGVATDVATVLRLLQDAAGTAIAPDVAPLRSGELMRSCLDAGRAREHLGWRTLVPLAEGLGLTYRSFAQPSHRIVVSNVTDLLPGSLAPDSVDPIERPLRTEA